MRTIDLDLASETLWLSFPYDETIVDVIRSLPRRRFHAESRRWAVPLDSIAVVVTRLEPFHFQHSPRMRAWWAQNQGSVQRRVAELAAESEGGWTVSKLNQEARRALGSTLPDEVWVVGTIEGWSVSARGNAHFHLVERGRTEQSTARVGAIVFETALRQVLPELAEEALDGRLEVRVLVRPTLYVPRGQFQVEVREVDASWGARVAARNREQVLAELRAEGIATRNSGRELGPLPLRVGLIASVDSDGYADFVDELVRSPFGFSVMAHDARVQGRDSPRSLLVALRWFAEHADELDVLAICRGGGAQSDLEAFDSGDVARAVCLHELKIVTGIGHHRDRSAVDQVAESYKTPTAAAQALVARVAESAKALDRSSERLALRARARLLAAERAVDRPAGAASRAAGLALSRTRQDVARLALDLRRGVVVSLRGRGRAASDSEDRVKTAAKRRLRASTGQVDALGLRLTSLPVERRYGRGRAELDALLARANSASAHRLRTDGLILEGLQTKLRLLDPQRVLERGFALVRAEGRVLRTAAELSVAGHADIQMADGVVSVSVEGHDDE